MEALSRKQLLGAAGIVLVLAAVAAFRWPDAGRLPFRNDDYVFLDKAARVGFADLWGFRELAFHWWRPWSRELHYWALSRVFGASESAFVAVNVLLWLTTLVLFMALARRAAGGRVAIVATAGAAAMAAWDLPLLWAAGAQDLWMMAWSLAALLAWSYDRRGWAAMAYALALASKETAALLPAVAMAWDVCVARRPVAATLVRAWPLAALTLAWGAVHPALGGRLWQEPLASTPPSPAAIPAWQVPLRALGTALNADAWPRPQQGWQAVKVLGLGPAVLLGVAAGLGAYGGWRTRSYRHDPPLAGPPLAPLATLALVWGAAGWAPLLAPGLGWHAYYALFGALGVWLLLGGVLVRNPRVAVAVVGVVALFAAARADTPSTDWGDAWYQRRSGFYVARMRDQLRALHPTFAPHARLWFGALPDRVGFLSGDGPALRVWYRDRTLRGGFLSGWRPRAAGEPEGPDHFFRADTLRGWVELVPGPEDVTAARRANPRWADDQQSLGALFVEHGAPERALAIFRKVAEARPSDAEPAYNAAVAELARGDTSAATAWLAEAARRPDVPGRVRAAARAAGLDLWP